jgi:natural product biosynthesis luciferase-like monooxygenase protein
MAEQHTALFIGNGSLLVQCAQAWQQRGNRIAAVVTGSAAILEWAQAQGVAAVRASDDAPLEGALASLGDLQFDYLFSIANLRMLPASLIERARALAINFHDGPLPRYAGLNATSWALMAREITHGVTWHEMTARPDEGRIVKQSIFPVSPADTALGLNARCYEVGLASFNAIADDIARGTLALTEQAAGRTYFARDKRPAALGTIAFSQSAADIAALVRALDFGPYPNPLGRAKLFTGDRMLCVATARVQEPASLAAPGTVVTADAQSLRIATAQGDVTLSGFTTPEGEAADHGLTVGAVLPDLLNEARAALEAVAARAAKGERFWQRAVASLAPAELPYPRHAATATTAAPGALRVALDARAQDGATAAAFLAWISALTGHERVSVNYTDAELATQAGGLEPWLTAWVPLTLATTSDATAAQACDAARAAVAQMREAGACPRDLPSRLGDKAPPLAALRKVALSLAPAKDLPAGCECMLVADTASGKVELLADAAVYSRETIEAMGAHLSWYLRAFEAASKDKSTVAAVPLVPTAEAQAIAATNATTTFFDTAACIHDAIAAQVKRTPQHEAIAFHGRSITYRELDERAASIARALVRRGVKPGDIVGLCLERTPELIVSLFAIHKAGAAYLPLDPAYPRDRIAFMIEDSATKLVVTDSRLAQSFGLGADKSFLLDGPLQGGSAHLPQQLPVSSPAQPAYVIYTSGSTGQPKGVVVTHRNAMNFFAGMDDRVPRDPDGRWLAVTSLSFDISVLELCWTLANGFTVVLHSETVQEESSAPDFSLFYFAADNAKDPKDRYKLLMEGAKFADREGFAAIWTPERHFHAFGGLYPNPALTSAAIAAVTERVKIRAGSCVLPLHHPVRVAEEWAFVDNISQGRVGISFASGWQPNDFVLAPQNFADRKESMISNIDVVRRLWRGEAVPFPGPQGKNVDIRTLPRPVQKELPVWLTAAGNPETFAQAGELGCHLLTHLLGQKVEDVANKLKIYRAAWRRAGHPGNGHVTLMLHTFVGDDENQVRETVRGPMKEYLRTSVDLIKQAAWTFPTFVQRGARDGKSPVEVMDANPLSIEEMDALLDHAFARYYGTSALFGTPERCLEMVDQLKSCGVDEIACLIDFGVDPDVVLDHLQHLKQLMDAAGGQRSASRRVSVAEQVVSQGVTHLQCTPSMASMLAADEPGREALSHLTALMVGGEALPLPLAKQLRELVPGALVNMYGPTETTVWSTTCDLHRIGEFVPLGRPIANTQLSIRTPWGAECPALVPGELFLGGEGVTKGYWRRPELTGERFVLLPETGARTYRTGDLVRRHADGRIEFLGRIDHQVKLRGHRIELGEIEAALLAQAGVKQAVVVARDDGVDGQMLVGYVTPSGSEPPQPKALREALAAKLPAIMVPQHVLVLPAMPLTPNGKTDRRALPDPRAVIAVRAGGAPESELEKTIAGIWAEVLGLPSVGTSDNFFDLGGHSLLVVQVQRRLREACGREVSITDMFRLPTVRALASHLGGQDEAASAVTDGLSRAQQRRAMRTRGTAAPV